MCIKNDAGATRTTMSVDLAKIKQTLHNAWFIDMEKRRADKKFIQFVVSMERVV